MSKLKNIMAYTNPIAIGLGIPVFVGLILGIFSYRIGKDVKTATEMVHESLED